MRNPNKTPIANSGPAPTPTDAIGTNSLIEPDHKAMLARLRDIAASATLHQQVSIDEADLRQLLAFADKQALVTALEKIAWDCGPISSFHDRATRDARAALQSAKL